MHKEHAFHILRCVGYIFISDEFKSKIRWNEILYFLILKNALYEDNCFVLMDILFSFGHKL